MCRTAAYTTPCPGFAAAVGAVLSVGHNIHGPALLTGLALGALFAALPHRPPVKAATGTGLHSGA